MALSRPNALAPIVGGTWHVTLAAIVLVVAAAAAMGQTPATMPSARVTLQIDSATVARFDARSFDLGVTQQAPWPDGSAAAAEIQFVKQAGAFSGDLIRLGASGARAPSGTIEVLDSLGAATLTVHLSDVVVVSDHISLSSARVALEQQRISQQETLTQLNADSQEAQRQLATAEELGKSHVTTRQDLAHARAIASELQQRLELARQRQALLVRQLQAQGALDETVVLHFGRLEIDSPMPGGHASWDFSTGRRTAPTPDSVSRRGPGRPNAAPPLRP